MKHLAFLYYSIAYSIGLPAIAVIWIAYLKTKNRVIKYYFPFLLSVTFQLILVAVLRYQDVSVTHNSFSNVAAKYLYFFVEGSIIFTLPFFCHALVNAGFSRQRNIFFGFLFIISLGLMISPYYLEYIPAKKELFSLWGFAVYRGLLFSAMLYSIILLLLNFKKLPEKQLRVFVTATTIATIVSFYEILHCNLLPVLKTLSFVIPLSPICYFVFNLVFMVYIVKRFITASVLPEQETWTAILNRNKVTEREKEIIALLIQGCQNKEISRSLFISESTVKTHIQNIYKKLGVQNRVQLINSLNYDVYRDNVK